MRRVPSTGFRVQSSDILMYKYSVTGDIRSLTGRAGRVRVSLIKLGPRGRTEGYLTSRLSMTYPPPDRCASASMVIS